MESKSKHTYQFLKESVAKSLGEGVVAVDLEGRIRFINAAACRLLCYESEAEAMGRDFHVLVHPEEGEQERRECLLGQALDSGAEVRLFDGTVVCREGKRVAVAITVTPVEEEGEYRGSVVVFRDMGEFQEMQRRLLSTDRMHAVGNLAAGIAHEINNPLAYVQSNVRFVHRALEMRAKGAGQEVSDAMMAEALLDALEGMGRINAVVAGMRAFTGNREVVEEIDLGECIQNALTLCQGELKQRAEVRVEGSLRGRARGNASRLTQVFVNLLLNASAAIEATKELSFGEIRIAMRSTDCDHFIEISDNGHGISADLQKQIFDPFFTTREVGDGTGLGLFVCRSILMEVGGDITVKSERGKGASFRVMLPQAGRKVGAGGSWREKSKG